MKWWDRTACRRGASEREVTGVSGSTRLKGWYLLLLSPLLGDPPSPSVLPTFPLTLSVSTGFLAVAFPPVQMGDYSPDMQDVQSHTAHTADWARLGPTSPLSVWGLVRRLAQGLPPSFRLSLPPPQTSRNPSSSRIAGAAWGHLLHAVSGRGRRPGHYVMIR